MHSGCYGVLGHAGRCLIDAVERERRVAARDQRLVKVPQVTLMAIRSEQRRARELAVRERHPDTSP